MEQKFYFAYGSNCNLEQMAYRCPNAVKVGPVTLLNYRLTFNGKRSGTGVANIHRCNGAKVTGLLWAITPDCEKSLDRYEGYPHLYEKKMVTVLTTEGKKVKAMVYIMAPCYNKPALPSKQYFQGIVAGFLKNGMDPYPVLQAVESVEAKCNTDGM